MPMKMVDPASVPWSELTGEALEELVYWLLDSMGACDLEWRAGGQGTTAPDGGRDLRATFYVPLPDGEIDPQVWWVQAKGTSNTVPKARVVEFHNLGRATPGIDRLVVATNGRFTNPTRDLVREQNSAASSPRLDLWDRDTLLRLLTQHPSVVAQVIPSALSPQGKATSCHRPILERLDVSEAPRPQRVLGDKTGAGLDRGSLVCSTRWRSGKWELFATPLGDGDSPNEPRHCVHCWRREHDSVDRPCLAGRIPNRSTGGGAGVPAPRHAPTVRPGRGHGSPG